MTQPAVTPPPPYFAAVFTSVRTPGDDAAYRAMAERMEALARRQPGFLGVESARGTDGLGITVSYWTDESAIAAWRVQVEHLEAQRLGIERWYERYTLRVCKVERTYHHAPGQRRTA
ncbi:MAG: antibiotic biosynthesis monooxygenase [Planctomycetes bacterium]|nr:antibiotic biosynthesis monooxygenase [Planctomycetota bacterium]